MVVTFVLIITSTEKLPATSGSERRSEPTALIDTNVLECFEIDMNINHNSGYIPSTATGTMNAAGHIGTGVLRLNAPRKLKAGRGVDGTGVDSMAIIIITATFGWSALCHTWQTLHK
jgi:hypothetical protein